MATHTQPAGADLGFESDRLRRVWYGFIAVLLAAGAVALYVRLTQGLTSTNLTSIVPWGAWVAFYIYFVGLSAGAFLVSTLDTVFGLPGLDRISRDALFVSLVSMAVALLFIWVDLGRMDRMFFPFIWRQFSSALSWEIHAYVLYMGVIGSSLYFSMRADLARLAAHSSGLRERVYTLLTLHRDETTAAAERVDRRWLKRIGIAGIPLSLFFVVGGEGVLFAVASARPYWNSGLFPVIFVVSALLAGTAFMLLLYVLRTRLLDGATIDRDLVDRLGTLLIGLIIADIAITAIELLISVISFHAEVIETWQVIMFGEMSWSFWWFMIGAAWVFPLVLLTNESWRRQPSVAVVAALSIAMGVVGVRFNLVVPAQILPVLEGLPHGSYFPTAVEWVSSFGIMGVGLLLYTIGAEILPLTPLTESESDTQ